MAAIELLKVWMNHMPPCVLRDVPDGLASLMIARKIGKLVESVEVVEQPRPTRPAEVTQIGPGRKKRS